METFTITRSRLVSGDAHELRGEILRRTGSREHVASLLRTLARFESDRSISHFEISPVVPRRVVESAPQVLWSVRAVRV